MKSVVLLSFRLNFFIAVFIPLIVQSQKIASELKDKLSEMNMRFNMPSDYVIRDSGVYFICGDGKIPPPIMYNIIKKDKSIIIAIHIQVRPTENEINKIRGFFNPNFDPDSNYFYHAMAYATGENHKFIQLGRNYVKKHFNADGAILYIQNCNIPVDNIYAHNKEIAISKNGRGFVNITYLYTDAMTEKEIGNEILKTVNMIWYNN